MVPSVGTVLGTGLPVFANFRGHLLQPLREDDIVIVQIPTESCTIESLPLCWEEFKGPAAGIAFAATTYHASIFFRGFQCIGLRVGLSSTDCY